MNIYSDTFYINLIGIHLVLLGVIVVYFKYTFFYWQRKNIRCIEPTIPFGNAKDFMLQRTSLGETILKLYKQLKVPGRKFAGVYISVNPQLLLLDPDLIKDILTKDFQYFHDKSWYSNLKKEPLTGHLFALTGEKWKIMRKKLTPTFTTGKMRMMFHTLVDCTSGLEAIIEEHRKNSKPIDIKEIFGRFTTDIIGSVAFGIDCNSLKDPDAEFRKMGRMVVEFSALQIFKEIFIIVFPELFKFLGLKQLDETVTNFFKKVVHETVEYREKNNYKRNDFMQLLINIKNTGNVDGEKNDKVTDNNLTINEIIAQVYIFFLAGFETSATTLTFFFYDMCQNPDIQEKVRKEIDDMLERYDNKMTYEGIIELQYLEQAIYESMRLHSAIAVNRRICTKDYKVPDTDIIIDKGTTVLIPVYGFQSDPEYYPQPEKYDPNRFNPEEKEKRHPFTFLPFGEGPRSCIGLRFGMLQTKVGIVALMRNYRFTLNEKTKVPLKMKPRNFIFTVEGGIWLTAERINR